VEGSQRATWPPSLPQDVRALIRRLNRENPLWGAPRIHGELLKLGIDIGETSESKALPMPRDDSGWLEDDECRSPIGPDVTEPGPEEPIRPGQLGSLHRTLKHTNLMTKRENLELQGRAAAE